MKLKFRPQTNIGGAVSRPRLVAQCLQGAPCSAQLSWVVAPPGFGKTTLLGEVRRQLEDSGWRAVWLNCDERDRDPGAFLRSLVEAFESTSLKLRTSIRDASSLIDALAEFSCPVAIFIDEYEVACQPHLDETLEEFARLLPDTVRVIVASRALSPQRFVALELDGFVRLVTASDLRFSDLESSAFLDSHAPSNIVRELIAQADGWAFVLQLIKLNARASSDGYSDNSKVGGAFVRIEEFLASEVMSCLDGDLRDFAIETSLLETVTIEDAEAITGRPDCANLIARLHPLIPIVSIESQPAAARFHPLFRSYLRNALQLRPRPAMIALHERLARQYARTGRVVEAVKCALGAGLDQLAASLIESAGGVRYVVSEGVSQAKYLLSLLPRDLVRSRLRLRLMIIGSLGNQDQTWRAALDLDALETEVHAGHFAEQFDEEAKIDLEVTRSIVEFVSAEHSLRRPDWNALRSETVRSRGRLGEDKRLHVAPLATEILLSLRQGRASEAAPLIDDYLLLTQSEKSARGSLDAAVFRAMLEFARAELGAAEATARRVVATCLELDGHDESHQATLAHAMLGQIDFLRNNLRAAVSHFEKLGRPEVTSGFEVYSSYYALRALCDAASGRPSDAFERLDNALAHARNWRLPHLALFATAVKCYLEASYSDGDATSSPEAWVEVADAWRENRGDDSLPWLTRLWLARALVASFLGKERPADAVTVARQLVEVCASSHQRVISAKAWILLGHTLLFAGQRAEGRQAVERALVMTDTTGATRLFLDQGSEVIDVVREVAADKSAAVCDWAVRIVGCTSPLELLTPRQKAVLRELAKGGSTKEIARALSLSPETVKTHLRVIFDRLGTSTREGAARAARQAHLASN